MGKKNTKKKMVKKAPEKTMPGKRETALKILIPCLLLAVVIGIYFFKNQPSADPEPDDSLFALTATEMIDFEALSEYGLPIIVDYGSDSCIPCQQMAPVLETMNREMAGKAFIKFVDVWEYTSAADNVPVQIIPTQVLFNADGTPFVPSDGLADAIEFLFYTSGESDDHAFTVHQGGMTEEQMRLILAEMGVAA